MKRSFGIAAAFIVVVLFCAGAASAGTISGTVHNGTTGKAGAGVDIILLNLQNGMDAVATTKTDAEGHYSLNYTPPGQTPMLIRAAYKGVNFHAMLPPGQTSADVQIYEPSTDAGGVLFPTCFVAFQPDGPNLFVVEEFQIQNGANPPIAYFKQAGNFEFQIPDGTTLQEVSAAGPEGMSVAQATINRGTNRYAIAFPFRPGESRVRVSYSIPYPSNSASLHIPEVHSVGRAMLLAPPTMTVSAAGFQPAGAEQGMSVYIRDDIAANSSFDVSISGTAPPPDNSGQSGQDNGGGAGRDSGQSVSAVPPRLDTLKWVLIGGFAMMFILGAGYLYRKPIAVAAAPGNVEARTESRSHRNKGGRPASVQTAGRPAVSTNDALGEIDRKVGASLDELKDLLFKLELRRQAGTISEQEYAEQRARAERILRDLVRG